MSEIDIKARERLIEKAHDFLRLAEVDLSSQQLYELGSAFIVAGINKAHREEK